MSNRTRVAIAVSDNRVSPVFDVSRRLLLIDFEDGVVAGLDEAALGSLEHPVRMSALARLDVGTLICGAISRPLASSALAYEIRLIPFVSGTVDEVLEEYLAGTLPSQARCMPGRGGRRRRRRRGRWGRS